MKPLLILFLFLASAEARAQATTVIVVRHAERAAAPANDPVLTPAGSARAEALLDAVRAAGVTHILTTSLARTVLTASPTAAALGIAPVAVDPRSPTHVQDVAGAIRARGGVVLVVGHSNTVPAIVQALGGTAPPMCDDEYDTMYIVTVNAAPAPPGVVRVRYGASAPAGPGCAAMIPAAKQR